jgi:uncharacterized protein YbaR (Trm112 family)
MTMSTLKILCPECKSELVVDATTGEVLLHEKPRAAGPTTSFEERLQALDQQKQKAEELFSKEVHALKDKERLMEERFQEALKKAKEKADKGEDQDKPIKDIDL